ncbi:hypothetical protein FANTH_2034 [Fusarium anthophilum]|uniref:Uncharacterized protein n=1 Tax=Fusarium anthophilum TaxID=48485 RepID=A0A8H4ZV67_9HYPO|nr:hypothetical protein FANTH_2034 [Fusarium anthophilum]
MSLFTAQLYPGRALGFLVLGATLHDVLTRLKAEPQRFPKIELLYSPDRPVTEPVGVELPANGIRLRFDGPEQRLRLIEVTDFTKNHITFKERDLVKPSAGTPGSPSPGDSNSGPTFRHIYHKLLGPTYAGEYIPPSGVHDNGIYVLSYPGVAFNFALNPSEYSPEKDVVSTFASASSQVATSMAVFSGDSWADARPTLWTEILPSIKSTTVIPRGKDVYPDEISLVRLHGAGKIQLFRKWTSNSFWITLGETTPQDLLMELGPPNAIYRKNDQKMVIHKMRTASNAKGRPDAVDTGRPEDLTDTDQSSMHEGSDASDNEEAVDDQIGLNTNGECFYNYFYLGFDILISTRVPPSQAPPGSLVGETEGQNGIISHSPDRLVATKLVLHGNIPGSYEFNRHRRCRWEIAYLDSLNDGNGSTDSETPFPQIEDRMNAAWASAFPRKDSQQRQRGMVLNRGWGDSPGSSSRDAGKCIKGGKSLYNDIAQCTAVIHCQPRLPTLLLTLASLYTFLQQTSLLYVRNRDITMSPTEKKSTTEPVDKEAVRKLINELEGKLEALYTLSDEVNRGILESQDALESVREKRVKLIRARLDRIFQQWNIGPLTSNHQPYVTSELCAFDAEYGFRSIQNQTQNSGLGPVPGSSLAQTQAGSNQQGQFGLPW